MPNATLEFPVHYAIGDVHGECDRLSALHDAIFVHHRVAHSGRGMRIVHLGDYVDRGPDSCGVIDALRALEAKAAFLDDVEIVCLMGNHEQMLLDANADEISGSARLVWLKNGGDMTMESYIRRGRDAPLDVIDRDHIAWLATRPKLFAAQDNRLIFVHAGIDPELGLSSPEAILLWTRRQAFFDSPAWRNPALDHALVVHGHTPTRDFQPDISRDHRRLNIDTGAVYGGRLTCAVIPDMSGDIEFLFA